jgi:hypothetical protein
MEALLEMVLLICMGELPEVVCCANFKVLASARIVCNIVCASARSNPQGNGQILVSCLINLILT